MQLAEKQARYQEALGQLDHLLGAAGKYQLDDIGKMATVATVLKMNLPTFFFVGFYRATPRQVLLIGPYQGDVLACGTIPYGRGVCGACAAELRTIIVPDVSQFPGYIACDDLTRSEIVVPVLRDGQLLAVLDVDGTGIGDFDATDQRYLEQLVARHWG
jgi:L-methionine (R)-S-oxide reductase